MRLQLSWPAMGTAGLRLPLSDEVAFTVLLERLSMGKLSRDCKLISQSGTSITATLICRPATVQPLACRGHPNKDEHAILLSALHLFR